MKNNVGNVEDDVARMKRSASSPEMQLPYPPLYPPVEPPPYEEYP